MKFYELLPVPKSVIESWARNFLIEVHRTLAEVVEEDNPSEVRTRNTRLAAYLGTLNALRSAQRQKLKHFRNKFIAAHPKPEKGITEWREEVDDHVSDTKLLVEHIESVIESIHINISTEQSNLKSYGREGQNP